MVLHEFIFRSGVALFIVIPLAFCGCAVIGPRSITAGRVVYADVINQTDDEQILNMIVRMRYDESSSLISVASITASLRFTSQIGTNIGIGSSDNYAGNLVPLSAGIAYEENPTISYLPLSGEDFMRRMLSPVSTREWLLLGGPAEHPGRVLALAVDRINGLQGPRPGDGPPPPKFARVVELYDRLRRANVLDIVELPETENEEAYFVDIHDYGGAYENNVRELLDLLGIDAKPDGVSILLPFRMAVGRSTSEIRVQTRSAVEVLQVFGAGVEIPPAHIESGIVEPTAWEPPEDRRLFRIRSSMKRPKNATVQIKFRDRWFYIDATDTPSKRAFMFLRTFIAMRLAAPAGAQQTPVLTVPVN
jgi:hypothetical protein